MSPDPTSYAKSRGHLGPGHPLAVVARRLCRELHPFASSGLGGVACGRCWEQAIRDDERAVLLFELPREIEPDPDYVDQVAVDRVCAGERLPLTGPEQAAAVAVLARRGWACARISQHLGVAPGLVREMSPAPVRRSRDGGEAA